ncbi:MAG TPA: hypothetical protein VMD30_13840 [Tepidisphaeraceae bacterium]|nr:hypothetical protein [Tepidisphaeraceae bacterium]
MEERHEVASAVIGDTPCLQCGYNLRTQPLDGKCPECGTAVQDSLRRCFRELDRDWVIGISRGLAVMVAGIVGGIVFCFCVPEVLVIAIGAFYVGIWMVTQPSPGGLWENEDGRSRRLARAMVIVDGAALTLGAISVSQDLRTDEWTFVVLLSSIGMSLWVPNYLAKLAMRIPNWDLAWFCRAVMWGRAASLGIVLTALFLAGMQPDSVATALATVGLVGYAVLSLAYLRLLTRLYSAIVAEGKQGLGGPGDLP